MIVAFRIKFLQDPYFIVNGMPMITSSADESIEVVNMILIIKERREIYSFFVLLVLYL